MLRMLRLFILPIALLLAFGFAAACDGGGDDDDDVPTATAIADAPDATATESSAGGTTIAARIEGDFVAPDSHAFTQRFQFGGLSVEESAVIIGADAWIREGGGEWRMLRADDPDVIDLLDLTSADPDFFDTSELADDLAPLDSELEEVNGVQTRRYFIPREAVATLIDLFGGDFIEDAGGLQEFEMTVWLAVESGALVKADFAAVGDPDLLGAAPFAISPDATVEFTMSIERTRVNDPDIEIEPPVGEASGEPGTEIETPFESYHYTVDFLIEIVEP